MGMEAQAPDVIHDIARRYAYRSGINYVVPSMHDVPEQHLRAAAEAYGRSKHQPNHPAVKASYDALKREVLAQYQHLKEHGYSFHLDPSVDAGEGADADVRQNKHLKVFSGGQPPADHPLSEALPFQDTLGNYNNVFRAVHDVLGHGLSSEIAGHPHWTFDAQGEDRAYRAQAALHSPLARHALAIETRGQNATFNYGPDEQHNKLHPKTPKFAEQKASVLPKKHSEFGLQKDEPKPEVEGEPPAEVKQHPIFSGKTFGILTAQKPKFKSAQTGENEGLKEHLKKLGLKHEPVQGHYEEPEESLVVHEPTRAQMYELGKQFGQESVIFSHGGRHQMVFTNGPQEGQYVESAEPHLSYFAERPQNYYTAVPNGPGFFRMNFNFENPHPLEIHTPPNPNLHPDPQARKSEMSTVTIPELRTALLERLKKTEVEMIELHKRELEADGRKLEELLAKAAPMPGQNPSLPNPATPDVNAAPQSPVGAGNQVPVGQLGPEGQAEMETGGGTCPLCGQPDLPGKCMCLQGGKPTLGSAPAPQPGAVGQPLALSESGKKGGFGSLDPKDGVDYGPTGPRMEPCKQCGKKTATTGPKHDVFCQKCSKTEKAEDKVEKAFKIAWSSYDKRAKKSYEEQLNLKKFESSATPPGMALSEVKKGITGTGGTGNITSQSTGGGGGAKPLMRDEGDSGAPVSAPTSALKSEKCEKCGEKMCKCVAKTDLVDAKGKKVERGVVGKRPPAASGIREIENPGCGSVLDPKKNSHAVTTKAEPPMAKPPSGKNPATMVPAAKPAAPKAMGAAPKPMGAPKPAGMPKPGMMGKSAPNPQMQQHALMAGSKAAAAPAVAAPKPASPLQHPANLGRANAMQSALAGAFQPKAPVHSGLELARPPRVAAAGAGLKVPGVHKSEGCPFCGKPDHFGDCQ